MISIDTDVIKQLAAAAGTAAQELESAAQLLNQITTHDDWGCKERVTINSYTENNRKKMQKLMEDSREFTNVIGVIAEEFVTTENGISNLFDGVESIIKNIISIPVCTVFRTPGLPSVLGSSEFNHITCEGYGFGPQFGSPMAITDFQNIINGMESK